MSLIPGSEWDAIDEDLVAYYTFENQDGESTVRNDAFGLGEEFYLQSTLNGTIVGSPSWTRGRYSGKGGMLFTGAAGSYVSVPDNDVFTPPDEMTIMLSYQPLSVTGTRDILGKRQAGNVGGFVMEQYAGGSLYPYHYVGGWKSNVVTATLGKWEHYVFTFNGSQVKSYRDGVLVDTDAAVGTLYNDGSPFVIGANGSHALGGNPAFGVIDEVAVFTRAFTDQEAKDAYKMGN